MENKLEIFKNEQFGEVRTTVVDGEPWFVGKDVAIALGYKNTKDAISRHVDIEDKRGSRFPTPSGEQELVIINESGLYSLILSSKLPAAKEFKRWVTSEVLPAIRQTGGYIAGQESMSPEELMASALLVAQRTLEEREARISALTAQNQIMMPKAEYFDKLVDRNLLTNFRETAKELHVKERAFISFLIENGYVYRDQKNKLQPYANKNEGLFELKECTNEKNSWSGTQTLITPKGRETFRLLTENLQNEEEESV